MLTGVSQTDLGGYVPQWVQGLVKKAGAGGAATGKAPAKKNMVSQVSRSRGQNCTW